MDNNDLNKKIDLGLKKKELQEKFGMDFSGTSSNLPPEVEMDWLNYIEKFEEQFEKHKTTSVWNYIGKPNCKAPNELSDNEIAVELDALLELMQLKGVSLSTLAEVEERELYCFIINELFQEEIDDMHIEGMQTCFTYEEFHPNAKLDIEQAYEYFLTSTLGKDKNVNGTGYDLLYIDTDNFLDSNNNKIEKEIVEKRFTDFLDSFDYFEIISQNISEIIINEKETEGELKFIIRYKGCFNNSSEDMEYKGSGTFKLKPSEYGGWDIYSMDLPGLSI